MKILRTDYTFDASAQTITFTDAVILEGLLVITNVTDNIIIYNFADSAKGGSVAGGVLTLAHDTTSMADTDDLQIWYWDTRDEPVGYTEGDTPTNPEGVIAMFRDSGTGETKAVSDGQPLPVDTGTITVDAGLSGLAVESGGNLDQITSNTSGLALEGGGNLATIATNTTGVALAANQQTDALTDTELRATPVPVSATDLDIRNLTNTDVVTAELSATDNAVLDTIAAKDFATQTTLAAINAKMVTGTDIGDVTINNASGASAVNIQDGGNSITVDGTVTINAIPAGTNNIGDVDVLTVITGTGSTNLGKAEDAAHTSGHTGVFTLGVRTDVPNTAATSATADYSQFSTDMVGGIRTALYETDFAVLGTSHVKKYYTSAGAATDGIVWSPAAGKRWYVTDIFINVSATATVTLEDDLAAGDAVVWKAELAANSGWSHHFGTPLFSGEDAADLLVTTSAGNVYITITGYEI